MRTRKRIRPVPTILAVFAIVIGIVTASIRPAHATDSENGCSRGSRSPVCNQPPPPH